MNLSIQSLTLCLLFFIFYQKKHFKNYEKLLFPLTSIFHSGEIQCFVFSFSFQDPNQKDQTKNLIFLNLFCNSKRMITSFRSFLLFKILSKERDWVLRKKSSFFMISFKITYFPKPLKSIGCSRLFTEIKKGYQTSLYSQFFAHLFHKNFPY